MSGLNYVNSISPSYNALSKILSGEMGFGQAVGGQQQQPGVGPLGMMQQSPAMDYRPPTAVKQENLFGQHQGYRPTTPAERSNYNQNFLRDKRNVGHQQGQVDPGLASAALQKESGGNEKSGGK